MRSVGEYLMPQALQSGVPSSASLQRGVFLVQQDAHILLPEEHTFQNKDCFHYNQCEELKATWIKKH